VKTVKEVIHTHIYVESEERWWVFSIFFCQPGGRL